MRLSLSGALLLAFTVAVAVVGGGAQWVSAAEPDRPNVLFIAVDDLRPELGAYGNAQVKSPSIDRLAREGMTFRRAYVQQALCSPSRTSVMTGMRPDTTRVWDLKTDFRTTVPDAVTLPQLFKRHGYFTRAIGKVYHNREGLDDALSWSAPSSKPKQPTYALPENASAPGVEGTAFESADVPDETYTDGQVARLAVQALRDLSAGSAPFFLAVGFTRPHLPFVAPKKYWDLYDPAGIALARNPFRPRGAPEYAVPPGAELRSYRDIPEGSIPDDLARRLKHGYYASVSYTDAQIGKLLDELDRLRLRDKTIVVLWGDNGWKLGEHDAWSKHTNTENDVKAPLIVSLPGAQRTGDQTYRLVEFVDIYPTLADLAGLPLPAGLEGTSFQALLGNPGLPWKSAAFSQHPRRVGGRSLMGYSMRTTRYRFTVWVDRTDPDRVDAIELYDWSVDRQENDNIANQPAQAATVQRLMAQWREGWRGALPPPM
jgi:arylsulfatase A-like enzyme